jgi:branched-chain amino acid transport system permease protein
LKKSNSSPTEKNSTEPKPFSFALKILSIIAWIGALYGLQVTLENTVNSYVQSVILNAGINILLALSLNWVIGISGQFSLGHAGLMAVGAYTSAMLSTKGFTAPTGTLSASLLFMVNLLISGLFAAFAGFLLGLPSLRLKGDYLAIVTLGFGEVIRVFFLNVDALGGARGIPGIPAHTHFFEVYFWVTLCYFVLRKLLKSPDGRALRAIREDSIASQAIGISLFDQKLRAFVLSAFFAGIGGGLYAHYLQFINPQGFDFNRSFEMMIMVVLGGMGSLSGSVVAAILLSILKEGLRPLQEITKIDFRMIVYSLTLIFMMLLRPNGLMGTKEFSLPFLSRRPKKTEVKS